MAPTANLPKTRPEATDLERRVLAHERILQALIAYMARTEPRFVNHLRERSVDPMSLARHEHDNRETDDYAAEFIRAVMLLGEPRAPKTKEPEMTDMKPVPPKSTRFFDEPAGAAQRGSGARKKRHLEGAGRRQVPRRLPPEGTCPCGCGLAQVVGPMTGSTQSTVQPDSSIQVAENEGMPPGPGFTGSSPQIAPIRRVTGTLTLGLSKTRAATDGLRSAKEKLMRHHDDRTKHPLARLIARMAVVAGMIASFAFPAFAQDAPMPANATARSYGEGWECDRGYRRDVDACLAIIVPENAYATNRTYGAGWECLHGFQEVNDATCLEVVVPDGGYLDPSGQRWNCLRGYTKIDDLCLEIDLPPNAYLADRGYGAAWQCDRGYEVEGDACVAIAVPENAYLNGSGYGQPWTCERGHFERDDTCEAVAVPENAYFDDASYGPGWKCNRGFAESDNGCTEIDLPDNAHLDGSGNRWECHRNFQRSQGRCVLND